MKLVGIGMLFVAWILALLGIAASLTGWPKVFALAGLMVLTGIGFILADRGEK